MSCAPLRLTLFNRLEALEPARLAVEAYLAPAALSPQSVFKLELVLEEIFMNLLWHAFKDGAQHAIELTVEQVADEVVLDFVDDGLPFDPTAAADPLRPSSMEEATEGGRGLALVRRAARSLSYQRREGRNWLRVAIARV